MDSSNKLAFLTGDLKLRADEITPTTWSKLVFDCIERCKTKFNYLPEQHPLKDLLNCTLYEYDRRVTPKEIVTFPKGVSFETKCYHVTGLETERIPQESTSGLWPSASGPNWKYVVERNLLLTCQGKLLLWVAKYHPQMVGGLGFRAHRSGTY